MQWLPLMVMLLMVLLIVMLLTEGTHESGYTPCTINPKGDYAERIGIRPKEKACKRACKPRPWACRGYKFEKATKNCHWLRRQLGSCGLDPITNATGWNVLVPWQYLICPGLKYSFDGKDHDHEAITYHPSKATLVTNSGYRINSRDHKGLDLTGSNDYITIGAPVKNKPPLSCFDLRQPCNGFTLSFWVKLNNVAGNKHVLFHTRYLRLYQEQPNDIIARYYYWPNPTTRYQVGFRRAIFDNSLYSTWVHMALVFERDDEVLKLYINAELKGQSTDATGPRTKNLRQPFDDLTIGSSSNDNMDGYMDEIMMHSEALDAEIVKRMRIDQLD